MAKKRLLLLILLFIIPVAFADSYYEVEKLMLDLEISNTISVMPRSTDYDLKKVNVYLSFYPREDFRQSILSIYSSPKAVQTEETYNFEWKNPKETELPFYIKSEIVTHNSLVEVTKKINFPIKDLPEELTEFIVVTSTVDYNNKEVMNLASDLAYGEDDLYQVVHKMGSWVNKNIEYNLNTKNAQATHKASWVIQNREGVCDELTNLFIGLCRALGIPARFISGISYSDMDIFEEKWSPHGWAEVYFPGYGWVPFDVTYGELGYIDPAHVKLKDAEDANRSSTKYEWEGYNVDLNTNKLKIEAKVSGSEGSRKSLVNLDAKALKTNIGFGSYDAVVVEIENPNPYYVPVELMLSRSEGITVQDDYTRHILLKPKSKSKEAWLIQLNSGQNLGYIYNYTIKAYTLRGASDVVSIMSSGSYKVYGKSDIEEILNNIKEEEVKTYSESVDLACDANKINYVGEEISITCTLHNIGNVVLEGLNVCIDKDCREINIPIGQKEAVNFTKTMLAAGSMDFLVSAKNKQVSKTASVLLDVWDRPKIIFDELKYPETITLDKKFSIIFKISPQTESVPKDIKINLQGSSFDKEWTLEQLSEGRRYILNVEEYSLSEKSNDFSLFLSYSDNLKNQYSEKKEFTISLVDLSLKHKAILLMNRFNIDIKNDMLVIALSLFFAGIIVGLVFKTSRKDRD